ncbi:MAG: GNAT family N-acetyltransferase [Hyphomicrobiales bacterium]|jgi:ribosomal-protein-alanine N-acetyltransferase
MSAGSNLDVHLRPYALEDADRLAVLLNDPDVTAMTATIPFPYARSDAEAYLSNARNDEGRIVGRAILLGDELVGGVGLGPRPSGREELGYWVGKAYWGRGIATRAVALFLGELRNLHLEGPIYAATVRTNEASQKVLIANGFVFSGEGECITPARDTAKQPSNNYVLGAL